MQVSAFVKAFEEEVEGGGFCAIPQVYAQSPLGGYSAIPLKDPGVWLE